jgi:hypothetical protein
MAADESSEIPESSVAFFAELLRSSASESVRQIARYSLDHQSLKHFEKDLSRF